MGLKNRTRRSQGFSRCSSRGRRPFLGGSSWPPRALCSRSEDTSPSSFRLPQQIAQADQIVGRQRPGEHPAHSCLPPESCLAHAAHGFQPAEDFFHPLAGPLAEGIAGVPRGTSINGTASAPTRVLRHVRGDAGIAQLGAHSLGGHSFCPPPESPRPPGLGR